ncbi:MAG: UDP-glucose 4-epimerase GalE [Saprospiraceae bacterium]
MNKKVLVSGGCGYIGSHTVVDLIENGFDVISVDNNINSDLRPLDGVEAITGVRVKNYQTDLCDVEKTRTIFEENPDIVGVIHFAALKAVGESVDQPWRYFHNNLNSLLNLIACCKEFKVHNFIFSSSCSVYGNTNVLPVTEDTPMAEAESPYARTKQMGENILSDFCVPNKAFNAVLLRYFNPAGAHESNHIGESPVNKALNLIPVITETAIGKRSGFTVFGTDYDTRDGSCIRDYIHVMDLANAHTKALQYVLAEKNESNCEVFNLGLGAGATVLEAIKAFEKKTGIELNYELGPRRAGDVVAIYADNNRASEKLDFSPTRGIEEIMLTAWEWEKKRSTPVES